MMPGTSNTVRSAIRLACLAALGAWSWGVMAHQSYITTTLGAASGSLIDGTIRGQFGFRHHSPWYVLGEAGWGGIPDSPPQHVRQNTVRLGGEIGYEGRHLGGGFRVGNVTFSGSDGSSFRTGGYLLYRIITIARLWDREVDLSREDRDALLKERIRKRESEVALAPILVGEYDTYDTVSEPEGHRLRALRIKLSLTWKFTPYFWLTPSYEGYTYTLGPGNAQAAATLATRQNRTVLTAPRGPFTQMSGIWGRVNNVMQLHGHLALTARESVSATIGRIVMPNDRTFGSIWVAYHRRVDEHARWAVSPGFEHVRSGSEHTSYFTVSFSYIPNTPYLPERSTEASM